MCRNEGNVREPGIRPLFWVTIVVAVVLLVLVLRGHWEWALVGAIAMLAFNHLPFARRRE